MQLFELLNKYQIQETTDLQEINQVLQNAEQQESPLVVKIFSTIGAWFATFFFLLFLAISGILSSGVAFLFLGVLGIIVSLMISQATQNQPFMEPLTVAMNIVGQVMFAVGLVWEGKMDSFLLISVIGLGVELAVLILSRNTILYFGATVALHFCFLGILNELHFREGIHFIVGISALLFTILWLNEAKLVSQNTFYTERFLPISFGLAVGFSVFMLMTIFKEWNIILVQYWFISSFFLGMALLYFNFIVWEKYQLHAWKWIFLAVLAIILIPTLYSPGIPASLLILSVGFQRGQKILIGIGILLLILFITGFYYNLQMELLVKSGILFGTGVLFLLAYLGLKMVNS